jgi:transglutaminase-like putative cysteine protease
MVMWEDSHGELIKGEVSLGPFTMSMFTEPKQTALDFNSKMPQIVLASGATPSTYTPPSDFAIATAITPSKKIEKPREVHKLVVSISGLPDRSLVLSDERQKVESDKAGVYQYSIITHKFDETAAARIPVSGTAAQSNVQNAAYLDTEEPAIKKAAADIRGGEDNSWKVAIAIRAWVHGKMTPDYSMGVPRSCTELLSKPRGVCRDYATLFTGIARAAGVPTRLAAGIVYAEGKFFYHAWVECFVGKWIPLDPTLGTNFVDATHIKFAQGDVTEMYNVARVIGKLKIEVVSAE